MILVNLQIAIRERRKVTISYKGTLRVINPYLIGINFKDNEFLRAYQVSGYSNSGTLPQWRMFLIKDIDNVELTNEYFTISPEYNPYDKDARIIISRVEI